MPGRNPRVIVAATLACLVFVAAAPLAGAHKDDGPDIKVALVTSGRCGTPADSLPVLVSRTGAQPGEIVGDFTVCVTSRGGPSWTLLTAKAIERVDVEVGCTGSEASVDPSCGGSGPGELSRSLVNHVGIGSCPSVPDSRLVITRRLSDLAALPLLLGLVRKGDVTCVRFRLGYEPADPAEAAATQSDRTTWRYAFSLTGLDDD